MKRIWKVAASAVLLLMFCGASFAQRWPYQGPYQGGNGPYGNGPYGNGPYNNGPYNHRNNNQARKAYQHGYRDGQNDRRHRHRWHPRHNDHSYLAGYRAGFGQGGWGWR